MRERHKILIDMESNLRRWWCPWDLIERPPVRHRKMPANPRGSRIRSRWKDRSGAMTRQPFQVRS